MDGGGQLGRELSFLDSGATIKKRGIHIKKHLVSLCSSHILLYVNLIVYYIYVHKTGEIYIIAPLNLQPFRPKTKTFPGGI
jgi:hypothetical protein